MARALAFDGPSEVVRELTRLMRAGERVRLTRSHRWPVTGSSRCG